MLHARVWGEREEKQRHPTKKWGGEREKRYTLFASLRFLTSEAIIAGGREVQTVD